MFHTSIPNSAVTNEPKTKSEGAVTLQRTLVRNSVNSRYMYERIDFWLYSIKNFYRKNKPHVRISPEGLRIAKWYFKESKSKTYQAPNWKIDPKYSVLFHEFRSDEFYHLKNLVEVIMREIVEITLVAEGFKNVQVYRTSDTDDVTAGADLIVKMKKSDGTRHTFAIDLAVSNNHMYLAKKQERTQTKCREYNALVGKHPETLMNREVIAISPETMGYFLVQYLKAIGSGKTLSPSQKL